MSFNVIGDVAGNYLTLRALLKKMPPGEPISIGDQGDRGPRSKQVFEFFMNNGRAVLGNHCHMMISHYRKNHYYESGIWYYNGGSSTNNSFGGQVPDQVINWVETLPKYLIIENCLISHAFVNPRFTSVQEACDLDSSAYTQQGEDSIIWNRSKPCRRAEYSLQIAGHNSNFGLKWFEDFAIGIDTSRQKVLTGIHLPSKQIYQQEFID